MQPGWQFGWKSDPKADPYAFWHKHFAGMQMPGGDEPDCADELAPRGVSRICSQLRVTLIFKTESLVAKG